MLRSASFYFIVVLLTAVSADCAPRHETNQCGAGSTSENQTPVSTAGQMSAPITWNDVAKSYERVRDYTALYGKEELAISKGEPQTIRLSFRKPFDVRMDWLNDRGKVDQTAVYRKGFNGGKVLARTSGLLGSVMGTVKLNPNDSLALEDSRHPITDAGLGVLIERARRDTANPQIASSYLCEEVLDGRPAYKFKLDAKQSAQLTGVAEAHHEIIWIDKELILPAKVEIYDSTGRLLERHRFKELHINVGLTDKTFTL